MAEETRKRYRFVTTLPESINPGTIAMLYFKRWTIEKAYNNSKSNLKDMTFLPRAQILTLEEIFQNFSQSDLFLN